MIRTHSAIALGAASTVAAATLFASPAQETTLHEFRFMPSADEALAVVVTETHDLLLQELSTRHGSDPPRKETVALRLRTRADALIADEREAASGRMRRRHVDLKGSIQVVDPASVDDATGAWNGEEFELSSPFTGVSVAYEPAAGHPDGYGRHYDAKALREQLLPRVAVPADWSRFLPPEKGDGVRSAAVGEEWVLTVADLEPLIAPMGFVAWRGGENADEQILRAFSSGVGGNLDLAFDGDQSGSVTAKLRELGSDPESGPFAEIEIAFDVQLRVDRTEFVEERQLEAESGEGVEMLGAELAVVLKGGATIRWGLDSGLPLGAAVLADETVAMSVRVLPPEGDPVQQTMGMAGVLASRLTFRSMPLAPVRRTEGR